MTPKFDTIHDAFVAGYRVVKPAAKGEYEDGGYEFVDISGPDSRGYQYALKRKGKIVAKSHQIWIGGKFYPAWKIDEI